MKRLLTGNEAIARGAFEAGISFAAAYPGTPSTEILENIAEYKKEIIAEWAPNEKVALESAIGASIMGARSLAAMKHVGVNVAADPLFTFAYTGVNGGMVLITADEPSMHSSQNEQDNRIYSKFAKVAMLEPSNSQECKDMVKEAIEISEKYDTLVLIRMTTRICHGKSLVEFEEREEADIKAYEKNINKYGAVPAVCRKLRVKLEDRLKALEEFSNKTKLNYCHWNDKKIGIITSGVAYQYSKEVFGDRASYLKLGFTNPLPMKKIMQFAHEVEILYVIEELEPFIEDQIKASGIECIGKHKLPNIGELNPDIIAKTLLGEEKKLIKYDSSHVIDRPPTLCAGCPHRGLFYELGKRKNVIVNGDIGCYGLGIAPPLSSVDTIICMGASISMAQRGGSVTTQVRFGKEIYSPIIGKGEADILVSFEAMKALRWLEFLKPNGKVIVNDYKIPSVPILTGQEDYPEGIIEKIKDKADTKVINAPQIAKNIGNAKIINIVLLGALVKAIRLTDICWEEVIRKTVKEKFVGINIRALNKGIEIF